MALRAEQEKIYFDRVQSKELQSKALKLPVTEQVQSGQLQST